LSKAAVARKTRTKIPGDYGLAAKEDGDS